MKRTTFRTPPAVARVRMYALAAFLCTRHAHRTFPVVALAIGVLSLVSLICAIAPVL